MIEGINVSENDFYELQGDSYRGSRYANFVGGGVDSQGNVSSAATENGANSVGTSVDGSQQSIGSDAPPTPLTPSLGLTDVASAALPFAGENIGRVAGASIANGSTFGEGISRGVSSLSNRVSGGLIGTPASPTNLAVSQSLGGAQGPATRAAVSSASNASNVRNFGSRANIGSAAGAGFATAAATLLTGGSVKDAAKSGAGTAIGTSVGTAIGGPIGGFIGGFIGGSIFCFVAGTPILMKDGSKKSVEDLELGDETLGGGKVHGIAKALSDNLYKYKNTIVSGGHAVFENGYWTRVEHSLLAKKVEVDEDKEFEVVYPVATQLNLLVTPWFVSSDIMEVSDGTDMSYSGSELLDMLNSMGDRNNKLSEMEKEFCTND